MKKRTQEEIKAVCSMIGYEYIDGYEGSDSTLNLKCPKCGISIRRNWRAVRKIANGYQKIFVCSNCIRLKTESEKAERAKAKARRKAESELRWWDKSFSQMSFKQCKKCGELFFSTQKKDYCSDRCSKAVIWARAKDKRIGKIKGAYKDDVALDDLFKRDKGICHICGKMCDYSDHWTNKNGAFIASLHHYPVFEFHRSIERIIEVLPTSPEPKPTFDESCHNIFVGYRRKIFHLGHKVSVFHSLTVLSAYVVKNL